MAEEVKNGQKSKDNTKKKMIRAKISRNRSQSLSAQDDRAPKPKVTFANDSSTPQERRDSNSDRRQKRVTIGPAAVLDEKVKPSEDATAVIVRSCPDLREDPEETEGDDETSKILKEMTEDEISAFREIFDMFDSNGGGTIGADDLDQALQSVDIKLTQEEVSEIFDNMDIDGSGEIEFDEFIRLVANTERFLQNIMSRGNAEAVPKENVLFDAIALFMKSSALASVNEIVRYYHTNAQRYANPHDIIGHYTAGARLIGLTQRQIRRDINNLTKMTSDSKSPYAQPLVTSLDTFFDEQSQSKKLKQRAMRQKMRHLESFQKRVAQDRGTRGKIRLQFMKCVKSTRTKARRDSLYLQFLSMQKHISKHISKGRRRVPIRGAHAVRLNSTAVNLPEIISIPDIQRKTKCCKGSNNMKDKLGQDLTFDDMELIRKQVNNITSNFYKRMKRDKLKEADKHWQELGIEEIKSETLRKSAKKAFLAYTDYKHFPISSVASSHCKTNLVCPAK